MAISFRNVSLQEQYKDAPRQERIRLWIHEHPTTVKILKIAGMVLGLGLLVALPFTAPVLPALAIVAVVLTGTALVAVSSISILFLNMWAPPHHDMKDHVFAPGKCDGGELFYAGDVPILSLDAEDPRQAGRAHGYLCGEAIHQIAKAFEINLGFLSFRLCAQAKDYPAVVAEIRKKVKPEYLSEIEGVVEGYQRWAKEHSMRSPKEISADDLLLLHLLPDSMYFRASKIETAVPTSTEEARTAACSAILEQDADRGVLFARTMDWYSLGLFGTYGLVIHRKGREGHLATVDLGLPGMVGVLTGMNEKGFSLAMNVCCGNPTTRVEGIPACFYNRHCLEHCATLEELHAVVDEHRPLGPYHLTAAESQKAESIHFYQDPTQTKHVIRSLGAENPLVTLNFRYDPEPSINLEHSVERLYALRDFYENRGEAPLEECLACPHVNNKITTHKVLMEPQGRVFKVAFDNAFAGRIPLQTVPTEMLFQARTTTLASD